jgi:predicted HTH domain antitoxin
VKVDDLPTAPTWDYSYNGGAVKLQIELDVAEESVDKAQLEQHLRAEAILALFADRKIPAGKAARDLGLGRVEFMELLRQRGIPYVVYTVEDLEQDMKTIERLRATTKGT